jgi:hypothetical protein
MTVAAVRTSNPTDNSNITTTARNTIFSGDERLQEPPRRLYSLKSLASRKVFRSRLKLANNADFSLTVSREGL